jgi:hypothetical protein
LINELSVFCFSGAYPGVRQFDILNGGDTMNMTRLLALVAVGMLSAAWARADSAHYVINLDGWDDPQSFTFIPNPILPPPSEINPCLPVGDVCGDASIRISNGGGSQDESGEFTFNSDQANADGNIFFANTGPLIGSVEITVQLNTDELNDQFECSGGNIFQNCGFVVNDPPSDVTLDIYYYNPFTPGGGIPSLAPEPSQWIVLLVAFAGIIAVRARKQSA